MLEALASNEPFLRGILLGLIVGFVIGAAWAFDRGKLHAIDAMRRWADANEVADPHEAIAARMRELQGMGRGS